MVIKIHLMVQGGSDLPVASIFHLCGNRYACQKHDFHWYCVNFGLKQQFTKLASIGGP